MTDLSISLALNSPNSSESCLRAQLPRGVDLLQVVADGADVDAEQLGHAPLVEPEIPPEVGGRMTDVQIINGDAMAAVAGDTVLDPFAGSGTTAAVAIELGAAARPTQVEPWPPTKK